jgi:phosphatidylglycerophosphatase C
MKIGSISNQNESRSIAVFDLDGTLTKTDTFKRFLLKGAISNPSCALHLPLLSLQFIRNKLGQISDGELKRCFLSAVFSTMQPTNIKKISTDLANETIRSSLRRLALEKIEAHRIAGDRLILATASLDIYANEIAKKLKFHDVIATKCSTNAHGGLSGELDGPNLKSECKLIALKNILQEELGSLQITAYSDHHSDLPLLKFATQGVAVNPTSKLAKVAKKYNIFSENWD